MFLNVALVLALIYFILGFKRPGLALITSPLACAVLVYATYRTGDEDAILQAMLGVPVIFTATVTSILLARCEPGLSQWPQNWAKWLLLGFAALLFILTAFVVVQTNLPPLGFPSLLVFVAVIGAMGAGISYGVTSKYAVATHVISTIGSSMRQNLPLPMALESAAAGRTDKQSLILMSINKWLVRGCSIAESITRGYPKCPSHALAIITAAEKINQLPLAFQSIEADMAARSEQSKRIEPVAPYYPLVLLLMMFTIVSTIMTFVVPSFIEVIYEFVGDMRLPVASRLLIRISDFILNKYGWVVSFLPIAAIIALFSYLKFLRRSPHDPRLLSRIGDFIKWRLPLFHGFEKSFSMVQVTEMLRLSLNAGCTVNDAIGKTLYLDINNCVRKRIERWLERVEAGENISDAARKCRLPRPLAWAFDDRVNQGNTPTILETLESMYRSHYNYKTNLARAVLSPCITLVLAATVGFVVYAIYAIPVAIIHNVADTVYP